MIVEYCRYGNLQTYLIKHRKNFINQVDEFGNLLSDADMQERNTAIILKYAILIVNQRFKIIFIEILIWNL